MIDPDAYSLNFYKSKLIATANNLYTIDRLAIYDYVWRYFSILIDIGDNNDYAVPMDFNPAHYLLLNPDVVYSGDNPYKHYIKHGAVENRKFSFDIPLPNTNQLVTTICDKEVLQNTSEIPSNKNENKKLIFHIGGPKTGSSALQEFLEENTETLEQHGFFYKKNNIFANGYLLFDLLRTYNATDDQLDQALLTYINDSKIGICSSEMLSSLNEYEWDRINRSCYRIGIDYSIIIYIRNLIPFMYSAYNQHIKMGVETRSIYDFSLNFPWMHFDSLKVIYNAIDIKLIKVYHYDSIGRNIVKHFLEELGIKNLNRPESVHVANRSLSPIELTLRRALNNRLGRRYSADLTNCLVEYRPDLKADFEYSDSISKLLQKRFSGASEWINNTFFDFDAIGISAKSSEKDTTKLTPRPESLKYQVNESLHVLKALCECISSLSTLDRVRERVFHFSTSVLPLVGNIRHYEKDTPPDFNPVNYLLLNPDVVFAAENAYAHYIDFGKNEGREYKLSNKNPANNSYCQCYDDVVVDHPIGCLIIVSSIETMFASQRKLLEVSITNKGQNTWHQGWFRAINLSYHWLDPEWNMVIYEGERTKLLVTDIPSAKTVITDMHIVSPPLEGKYYLVVTLVQEFEGWFDEISDDFIPAITEVNILPSDWNF